MTHRLRRRKILGVGVVPTALLLAGLLVGCAHPRDSRSAGPTSPPANPIVIDIGEQRITGTLDESEASASLLAQLPLTLSFRYYGGQEKIASLPAPLSLEGAPAGNDAAALTIGYYQPDQGLVLYYEKVGYFTGIVTLGTFESADALTANTSDFTATIRAAT